MGDRQEVQQQKFSPFSILSHCLQMLVDLAIVGPGVLGSLVAEQYKSINSSATISLVFRSENAERRDRLEKVASQCLLVADGTPMSRQAILDAALKHPQFREEKIEVVFSGGEGVDGKVYDCSKVRDLLGWKPSFASFKHFMELETKL